jgi:hypothetical protein
MRFRHSIFLAPLWRRLLPAAGVSLALVLSGCVTVTRTRTLQSEAARAWMSQTADHRVRVDSPGDAAAYGRIVGTTPQSLQLQGKDGRTIELPVRDGTKLRESKRGLAGVLGAFAGLGVGVAAGLVMNDGLATSNPDSAGGKEHPPWALPLGILAGSLLGSMVGAFIGNERRLEVQPHD